MSSAPPVPEPTGTQLEYMLKFRRIDSFTSIALQVIKWGFIFGISRYGYFAIAALAGRQTVANIIFQFLGSLKGSRGLAYLFGAGGIIYGYGERKLRQRNIHRLANSKNDLERKLDPNRTSSNISKTGTTRPGDKR